MSLLSVIMECQGGRGASILDTMKFAVLPIAKVFTMCFLGFLMASKHVNILPASGRKLLNGLVFSLLLPCLIFSQLGQAITLENLLEWWYIPVNVIMATLSGSLIGFIVASIVHPPYPYFKFTIIHIGIGNIGNIPLVLIAALCRDKSNPFGDSEKCSQDGNAYISFGQWVGAIILYTYVFKMLAPPPGETFDGIEEEKLPTKAPISNVTPEQVSLLASEGLEETGLESPRRVKIIGQLRRLFVKLKIKQIFQPPIIASFLAIVIGGVPFLKHLILTDDAPLFFFTDSCLILGEAMIPCILLSLGGNLIDGPGAGSSKLGFRTTAAIISARLLLVPAAGLGIVTLSDKLGFIPGVTRCSNSSSSSNIQCPLLFFQVQLPIYEDAGRSQLLFSSGFTSSRSSPWPDGLFSTSTFSLEQIDHRPNVWNHLGTKGRSMHCTTKVIDSNCGLEGSGSGGSRNASPSS